MMRMFVLIRWKDVMMSVRSGHKMKEACNDENVPVNKMEGSDDECTCEHKMKEACNDEMVRVNKMEGCDDKCTLCALDEGSI